MLLVDRFRGGGHSQAMQWAHALRDVPLLREIPAPDLLAIGDGSESNGLRQARWSASAASRATASTWSRPGRWRCAWASGRAG